MLNIDLKIIILLILVGTAIYANSQQMEDVVGYWKSCDDDNNMVVKVQLNDTNIPIGYLVGFQEEDGSWEKRKPKKGIKVMYNFQYDGNLKWSKGKIYDPLTQRRYRGTVELQSKDTIKAVGYWAFLWDDIHFSRIKIESKDEPK